MMTSDFNEETLHDFVTTIELGRRVYYHCNNNYHGDRRPLLCQNQKTPMVAAVAFVKVLPVAVEQGCAVQSLIALDLQVLDHRGNQHAMQDVPLLMPDDEPLPRGTSYATLA